MESQIGRRSGSKGYIITLYGKTPEKMTPEKKTQIRWKKTGGSQVGDEPGYELSAVAHHIALGPSKPVIEQQDAAGGGVRCIARQALWGWDAR